MATPKKGTGNQRKDQPPVHTSKKNTTNSSGGAVGEGGSRQGNAGHQSQPFQGSRTKK